MIATLIAYYGFGIGKSSPYELNSATNIGTNYGIVAGKIDVNSKTTLEIVKQYGTQSADGYVWHVQLVPDGDESPLAFSVAVTDLGGGELYISPTPDPFGTFNLSDASFNSKFSPNDPTKFTVYNLPLEESYELTIKFKKAPVRDPVIFISHQ